MSFRITYLPGDGVGPEVGGAALAALDATARRFGIEYVVEEHAFGGAGLNAFGVPFPDLARASARAADAVLLGAVGGPQWDGVASTLRPETGLLALRKTMEVWANLRLIAPHAAGAAHSPLKPEKLAGVDILFVRELTGGAYFGAKSRDADRASDDCVYTAQEIERVARRAGELARKRRGHVTSVDKANVMETSRLWRDVTSRIFADEFPEVTLEHMLVDAAAMHLLQNPQRFDVIVTENMFGDILTDEASVLCGSLGLPPSASLGDGRQGLYEPIHGSAPDIAGKGRANPIGAISSVALMLRYSFDRPDAADALDRAVADTLAAGVLTPDLGGTASTQDVADAVAARVKALETAS